jgi:gluconate 2-dehydrogenase alpha chain
MNPREIKLNRRTGSWNVTPYQTTHNTGGAIMGDNPKNSVVNRYLQSWDVPNVFSMGAGAFPQNAGYNPTATLAALAYMSADAIKSQYLKSPGPLVGG